MQDASIRVTNFDEVEYTYTNEEAKNEANRCLNCLNPRCEKKLIRRRDTLQQTNECNIFPQKSSEYQKYRHQKKSFRYRNRQFLCANFPQEHQVSNQN